MDLNEAVRKLRETTGESQQAFATRLKLSIRAIVNYEKDRIPSPRALAAMAHLARKHGAFDLANLFWSALPEELQSIPIVELPQTAGLEDAKLIYEMLPKPGPSPSQGPTAVQLTDTRAPIIRCIWDLQSLVAGPTSKVSGSPAETIRSVVDRLEKITKLYGQTVRVLPSKVEFGEVRPKEHRTKTPDQSGE